MKALLFAILIASPLSASINESIMLDAIADVETGNRDIVGKAGERGRWQLAPSVRARVGGHDRAAATRWLRIMMADMERYRIPVNVFNTALVYNAGINAIRKGRAPMSSYEYSQRVRNTYDFLLTKSSR